MAVRGLVRRKEGGRGRGAIDSVASRRSGGLDGSCSPVRPTSCDSTDGAALWIRRNGSPSTVEVSDAPPLVS